MKKALALVLAAAMMFALAACGSSNGGEPEARATGAPEAAAEQTAEPSAETGSKALVAWFSCTGNTAGVAEKIAAATGADLYEIVPEQPYTDADLNYGDDDSRTSIEQNDDSARPAISGSVENMEQYDTVFIGYPIWWGQAPKIIYTFVESYDLGGKTWCRFAPPPAAAWAPARRISMAPSPTARTGWTGPAFPAGPLKAISRNG